MFDYIRFSLSAQRTWPVDQNLHMNSLAGSSRAASTGLRCLSRPPGARDEHPVAGEGARLRHRAAALRRRDQAARLFGQEAVEEFYGLSLQRHVHNLRSRHSESGVGGAQ